MRCEEIMVKGEALNDLGSDLDILEPDLDHQGELDRDALQQAKIDAAIAELQAELMKLDKRTLEISVSFRQLREQRDALTERVIAKIRKTRSGQRKASTDAMRDISRAYKAKQAQQAQTQRVAPRRRYAPAKTKQSQRPAMQQQAMQQRQLKPNPPPQVIKVTTQPAAPAASVQTQPPKPASDTKAEIQRLLAKAGIELAANDRIQIQPTKPIQSTEPTKPEATIDTRRLEP
ncbi:MAG: hypothetical protein KGO21_01900 [Hyphomicrobiales bacterium]|nr:hypothetical protein [Hyphomicrobiales bacterium]